MTMRRVWTACVALALCLFWATASARTLERGNGPEPDSLDPQRAQGLSAQQVLRDLYEGLLRDDAEGRLGPGVALRHSLSEDGLHYRFELDPAARWSDGEAVLAQHFVDAFERALDPATGAPYAAMLRPIRGADARLRGDAEASLGVRAEGPHLLHIELAAAQGDFLRRLAMPIAFPLRMDQIAAHPRAYTRPGLLIGNGAYRLVEWTPQSSLTLERNPHYRRAAQVAIARVRFHVTEDAALEAKRYAAGELHLTETLPPGQLASLREQHGAAVQVAPAFASFYLGYNLRHPPLRDAAGLREALSLAVDREVLVQHITGNGELALETLIPALPGAYQPAPSALLDGDIAARRERARELYAAAGYSAERPLEVELRYNQSLLNRRLALAVAAMWRETLGFQARLRAEEWKVFVQNRRAGVITQVFRAGWFADYADPLNFLAPFRPGDPLNATGFDAPGFATALAAAEAASGADRARRVQALERSLLDAHALLPLFQYTSKHLVSPKLCGYRPHPLDHHPSEYFRWCGP